MCGTRHGQPAKMVYMYTGLQIHCPQCIQRHAKFKFSSHIWASIESDSKMSGQLTCKLVYRDYCLWPLNLVLHISNTDCQICMFWPTLARLNLLTKVDNQPENPCTGTFRLVVQHWFMHASNLNFLYRGMSHIVGQMFDVCRYRLRLRGTGFKF